MKAPSKEGCRIYETQHKLSLCGSHNAWDKRHDHFGDFTFSYQLCGENQDFSSQEDLKPQNDISMGHMVATAYSQDAHHHQPIPSGAAQWQSPQVLCVVALVPVTMLSSEYEI